MIEGERGVQLKEINLKEKFSTDGNNDQKYIVTTFTCGGNVVFFNCFHTQYDVVDEMFNVSSTKNYYFFAILIQFIPTLNYLEAVCPGWTIKCATFYV